MLRGLKMGRIRERMLPAGWYPEDPDIVKTVMRKWSRSAGEIRSQAVACVVPHAGWDFSGELAFS